MRIEYSCTRCGETKSNQEIDSMICKCGGNFRPQGALFGERPKFDPYYDRILGSWVSSYSEQERKAVAHRSKSHPEGLRLVQWDRKYINELKNINRHKEDYKQSEYKDARYKAGSKAKWSDKAGEFLKSAIIVLFLLSFSNSASALLGVDYIKFEIKGIEYNVPIPNKEVRQTFRELREALDGNSLSREMLLGGKKEKFIYIGDLGANRWVKLTENDVEVIEYK